MNMKKLIIAAGLLAGLSAPALAASSLSVGGGFQTGQSQTANAVNSTGTAAAGSLSAAQNTSIATGLSASTPAGPVSAGVGASVGQTGSTSGALSAGTGAAQAAGAAAQFGAGVGFGFTNQLP
jgi:hypothetical protein